MSNPEMVYIMGRGHSGSTVLDGLLGSLDDVVSVGELVSGLGRPDSQCSCGQLFPECPYWREVAERYRRDVGASWDAAKELTVTYSHVRWFPRMLARTMGETQECYLSAARGIVRAIAGTASKRIVVESSKEPTRALMLARGGAKIIHLVRNPRSVLESNHWRIRQGRGFRYLRRTYSGGAAAGAWLALSAVSWSLGAWLAERVRAEAGDRFLRVRFEDLCANPRGELERIGAFIGADVHELAEAVEQGRTLRIGHTLGGNYMRHQGSFVFRTPSPAGRELPRRYRWMPRLLCWPARSWYGYRTGAA